MTTNSNPHRDNREPSEPSTSADTLFTEAAKARIQSLIEAIPDGVVIFGPGGKLLGVNHQFAELYGIPSEQARCLDERACQELILSTLDEKAHPAVQASMTRALTDPLLTTDLDVKLDGVLPAEAGVA